MPRARRAENRGLPKRWQFEHGAYYYRVPPGLESQWEGKRRFLLGRDLPAAHKVFAERIGKPEKAPTIAGLLDAYAVRVVPGKASPKTRSENLRHIRTLRAVLGENALESLEPMHVYQYREQRTAKISAHREIEVLSHAYTKAVEWGWMRRHPFKGEVRLPGEPPRTRYVEDWELIEALSLTSVRKRGSVRAVQAYIRLKLLTGLRRSDLLRIRIADIRDGEVR